MSVEIASSSRAFPRVFADTASLRQAVMSPADAYSRYERHLLDEVNTLRCNPAAYADMLANTATVSYPFVRDDPTPACCSAMTLPQLQVYVADFRRERRRVAAAVAQLRQEWDDAITTQQLRWTQEDAERARRGKRGSMRRGRGGAAGASSVNASTSSITTGKATATAGAGGTAMGREEDFTRERERESQELHTRYTQKMRELENKGVQLERACKWAIEGANLIITCAKRLARTTAAPPLEYSRGLTLAARDVGNECYRLSVGGEAATPPTPDAAATTTTTTTTRAKSKVRAGTTSPLPVQSSTQQEGQRVEEDEQARYQEQSLSPFSPSHRRHTDGEGEVLFPDDHTSKKSGREISTSQRLGSQSLSSPALVLGPEDGGSLTGRNEGCRSNNIDDTNNSSIGNSTTANVLSKKMDSSRVPRLDALDQSATFSGTYTATVNGMKKTETMLRKTTTKVCGRYGYFSGELRGLQLYGSFTPRKTLIQMLLGLNVPQVVLVGPNTVPDICKFLNSHSTATDQLDSPLLWDAGRMLGCGWVRSTDGAVSVTVLIATNYEELSLIHERRDFSLPQIRRILNSRNVPLMKGLTSLAMVHIHSKLDVQVVKPVSHPIFVDSWQKVVCLVVKADANVVEITATVNATAEPIPVEPLLDRELLLIQRRRETLEEVEILLDIRAACRRWLGEALLVHLFEKDKRKGGLGSFTNIGFIRVTPTTHVEESASGMNHSFSSSQEQQQEQRPSYNPVVCTSTRLTPQSWIPPVEAKEELYGWPRVTSDFYERCATIIEPLAGTWIAIGDLQHIAVQIPTCEYLQNTINYIRFLIEKEERYLSWEERSGAEHHIKKVIESTMEELKTAEETLNANSGPIQQEIAQLQKNMSRKRNKEAIKLKKQEEELRKRLEGMQKDVEELQQILTDAEGDLVMLGREYTLHAKRRENLEREYQRLCERADRTKPLRVEVTLVAADAISSMTAERTALRAVDSACTLYEGDVRVMRGFTGCALLLVSEEELIRWEVRPGY